MSLQHLTTTCPHTHITHMKPHPTHALHTHIHEGPTEGAPHTHTHTHLQGIHTIAVASPLHNILMSQTHKLQHTNYNTHTQSSRQTWRRTRVCNNQHTHTNTTTSNTITSTHMQAHRNTCTPTHTHTTHTHTPSSNQTQHTQTHTHTTTQYTNHTQPHTHTRTHTPSHTTLVICLTHTEHTRLRTQHSH